MRTFRNLLKYLTALVVYTTLIAQPIKTLQTSRQKASKPNITNKYYPLAVGNSWTYRVTVEGRFQYFEKFKIVSIETKNNRQLFHTEFYVGKDPKPAKGYIAIDPNGDVVTFDKSGSIKKKILITANPKISDEIDGFNVVRLGWCNIKSYSSIESVQLENYRYDDATSSEQQLLWHCYIYGKGIGMIQEAVGDGSVSTLINFEVKQ